MRLLVPLLVLAGITAAATGALQMAFAQGTACTENLQCENFATLENALAGMAFYCIALMLWAIAGTLVWMRRKFEESPF